MLFWCTSMIFYLINPKTDSSGNFSLYVKVNIEPSNIVALEIEELVVHVGARGPLHVLRRVPIGPSIGITIALKEAKATKSFDF